MQNKDVQFINHDGEYPIFCYRILTVKILGKVEKFQLCLKPREEVEAHKTLYPDEYPNTGYWVFNPAFNTLQCVKYDKCNEQSEFEFHYFKKQSQKIIGEDIRLEIEKLVNENVQQHCCNGCD
jgi:hypothetical protein